MQKELLKDSVDVLKHLKTELHGNVEDSVINQLDKVIQDLEIVLESEDVEISVKALELLIILGRLIEKLPQIAKLLEYLNTLDW